MKNPIKKVMATKMAQDSTSKKQGMKKGSLAAVVITAKKMSPSAKSTGPNPKKPSQPKAKVQNVERKLSMKLDLKPKKGK